LVGWLVGRSVGRSVDWSVGRLVKQRESTCSETFLCLKIFQPNPCVSSSVSQASTLNTTDTRYFPIR
jgi:hypothetical protein